MLQVQWVMASFRCYDNSDVIATLIMTSSETQGQIVGARESLNGRENMARRKVKNGENSRFLLFFVPYFFARLDFPSPPLSAPGSPRMWLWQIFIFTSYNCGGIFLQMFVCSDVVYAQNWQVLTLKNFIEALSHASTAYVVASYGPRFFSTVL